MVLRDPVRLYVCPNFRSPDSVPVTKIKGEQLQIKSLLVYRSVGLPYTPLQSQYILVLRLFYEERSFLSELLLLETRDPLQSRPSE